MFAVSDNMNKGDNMNKDDIVKAVAVKAGVTQMTSKTVINSIVSCIIDALLADDKVFLRGFGTFTMKERDARIGRNPATGESIDITSSKTIKFKMTKGLI